MSDLFRREAVEHSQRRIAGEVVLATPLSAKLLGGLLVAVVAVALVFVSCASYARRETVAGWIVPQAGLIRVEARGGGVVESLPVREGAQVPAGATLAVVRLSSDLKTGDAGAILQQEYAAEDRANAAQTRAARVKLEAQGKELVARRDILNRELAELKERLNLMERRDDLSRQQLDRGEKLFARGFISAQALDQLRSSSLGQSEDTSSGRTAQLDLERQISDLNNEIASLPAQFATLQADFALSHANLEQRETASETQQTFIATAPVGGRVVAIPVHLGQALSAGAAVSVLTPSGSKLTAELYVPTRAAGFIKPGQEVRLLYQAFPYQTFGTGRGVISSISRTVLAPSDVAIPGLVVQEPVFRVKVRLDRPDVMAYGRPVALQPGMLLTAEVTIDRRTLIQWLLDPLYAAGRRT